MRRDGGGQEKTCWTRVPRESRIARGEWYADLIKPSVLRHGRKYVKMYGCVSTATRRRVVRNRRVSSGASDYWVVSSRQPADQVGELLLTRTNVVRDHRKCSVSCLGMPTYGWRRGWDSNPRALADKTLSRRPRYDHFGTSPFITSLGGAPFNIPHLAARSRPASRASLAAARLPAAGAFLLRSRLRRISLARERLLAPSS